MGGPAAGAAVPVAVPAAPGGGRFAGPPPGAGMAAPPAAGFAPPATGAPGPGTTTAPPTGGLRGGGPGGADSSAQAAAVAYVRSHGGGTIATSSQNGTSAQVIAGADIAAIGGFSGRESQVSAAWLADAVQAGRIRWVLAEAGGMGGRSDTRTGSSDVMALVQQVCATTTATSLYDCSGQAAALRSGG